MQFDCENIIEAEPVPEVKMNRSADSQSTAVGYKWCFVQEQGTDNEINL